MSYSLRRLIQTIIVKLLDESYIRGRLGRKNSDGSITISAPDRKNQGYVYVTLTQDGSQTVTIAENAGVPEIPNLPVKMIREDGRLVIVGIDTKGGRLSAFRNGGNTGSVAKHNHLTHSGLEYENQTIWFEPGRVLWAGAGAPLSVTIRPFFYFSTISKRYPGGVFDLTTYKPPTTNMYSWVIIGLDAVTDLPIAVRGAEYATLADLTDARIAEINFGNNLPLSAIQVFEGDTALSNIDRYRDARHWIDFPSFPADNFISNSGGPTDAGKPVKTNFLGEIDPTLIPPFQYFNGGNHLYSGIEVENTDLPLGIISGGLQGCDNGAWIEWFVIADPLGTSVADAGNQFVAAGTGVSISPIGDEILKVEIYTDGTVFLEGTLTVLHKVSLKFHWIT